MRASVILSLLSTSFLVVSAQSTCLLQCLEKGVKASGCVGIMEVSCLCSSNAFGNSMAECIKSECPQDAPSLDLERFKSEMCTEFAAMDQHTPTTTSTLISTIIIPDPLPTIADGKDSTSRTLVQTISSPFVGVSSSVPTTMTAPFSSLVTSSSSVSSSALPTSTDATPSASSGALSALSLIPESVITLVALGASVLLGLLLPLF